MLKSERDKRICAKYSAKDKDGHVQCDKCPLIIIPGELMCKATCHYDRHLKDWVFDDTSITIEKKILPKYFKGVAAFRKTFEIRKDEDAIEVGDILVLKEWDEKTGYTGEKAIREVTYVLRNCPEYGLKEGYCIIGMQPIGWQGYRSKENGC